MKAKQILAIVLVIAMLLGMSIVLISSVNAENGAEPFGKTLIKEKSALTFEEDDDAVYISGLPEKTTVSDLLTNLTDGAKVIGKKEQKKDDEIVSTGDRIDYSQGIGHAKIAYIIVKGDADGNGIINVTDYIMLKRHILGTYKLEGVFEKASDIDGDEKTDTTDIIALKRHFIKISGIGHAFVRLEDEIILPTEKPVPVVNGALNNVLYNSAGGSEEEAIDTAFLNKLSDFSTSIYEMSAKEGENYSVSPLSIYMALAVLNAVGDDNVKGDIEALFGMDQEDIAKTGALFRSLITEKKDDKGVLTTKLDLTNSVWLDTNVSANQKALDQIAELLYCYAYGAPFHDDNTAANEAVREFIKEKTNGLIDSNFNLKPETLFAIINTLYFKDIWGYDYVYTENRNFYTKNKTEKKEFIYADYIDGAAYSTDVSDTFYAETLNGYKIKFILPKEGKTLSQAMTAENLDKVNSVESYLVKDEKNDHKTRCIFPSFNIECDTPLKEIFASNGYLENAFSAYQSTLLEEPVAVSDIKHKVVLKVDKKGIEGAAVTIIVNEATAIMPEKPVIYHDFVLDREFGFLITDKNDVILFAGQVTEP